MTYNLEFHPLALKEWKKLAPSIQQQFKKKLQQRLANPRVPASKLSGHTDAYKIKLRTIGYRLVYIVRALLNRYGVTRPRCTQYTICGRSLCSDSKIP